MKVRDLTVGDSYTEVVVEDLTRTQIVMYAGASGDFNPMHTDEVYAVQIAGFDSVMAHGQLTMGLSAKVLTHWLPAAEVAGCGARFRRQVWPGATLSTTWSVNSIDVDGGGARAELAFVTTDVGGMEVLTGYAKVSEP